MAEKQKNNKKQIGKYIRMGILAVLVILLAIMPVLASRREAADNPKASILSAVVERKDIHTRLSGGGQLSSQASISIRIPENVKLTRYLVGNGDTVLEGDPIAQVDKVSVMTAITGVQETLDYLSEQITSASYDTASTVVKALAGGRVKIVYAQPGDSVQDVMLEHGALAVLSLDNTMAVQVERQTTLDAGDKVCVTFSDGSEVEGRVKSNVKGLLTVTVEDKDYAVGEPVVVTTDEGERLGSGELYIHSPWNATAYSGTVKTVYAQENTTFYGGQYLFYLENTGNTAQFQRLIDQRQEYEDMMQSLFAMYRTGTLNAPCDGIVTGVDEDGAYLLSGSGKGWVARLLSNRSQSSDGFVACAVQVTQVTDRGMTLAADPDVTCVSDLALVSGVAADPAAMTRQWDYSGDTTVYTQGENGLLSPEGNAQAGDILIALGDQDGVRWFVRFGGEAVCQTAAEMASDSGWIVRLSEEEGDINDPADDLDNKDPADGENPPSDGENPPSNGENPPSDGENPPSGGENPSAGGDMPPAGDGGGDPGVEAGVKIKTSALSQGVINQEYLVQLELTQAAEGQWIAEGLGVTGLNLTIAPYSGVISGIPTVAGEYAVSVKYVDGTGIIDQKFYVIKITDGTGGTPGGSGGQGGMSSGGMDSMGSGMSGGMPSGGMGGMGAVQTFTLYSLEELTVASVTSQEHMTLAITVDELEITRIQVGQSAVVTVDALGGVQFDAQITGISNSGENEGGNSKFTVELQLSRSGEMLPGMYASAVVTLATQSQVPAIPVAALAQDGGDTVVYTGYDPEENILTDPVKVKTGVSDGETVQILEGLEPGQTFFYSYYDTYVDSEEPQQGGFPMMGR